MRSSYSWLSGELFLLLVVYVHFFDLVPLLPLSDGNISLLEAFLLLLIMYLKYVGFRSSPSKLRFRSPVFWIYMGVFVSFIPSYLYYNQHFIDSVIVNRWFFCFMLFPALMATRPTWAELRNTFYAFFVFWILLSFIVTFFFRSWVSVPDGMDFLGAGDLLHVVPGARLVMVAFIFAIDQWMRQRTLQRFAWMFFVFVGLFLLQGRTLLVAAVIIILVAVVPRNSRGARMLSPIPMVLLLVFFLFLSANRILIMWNETVSQVNDLDYNRIKALVYMLSGQNGPMSYLWGNGFISGNVNSIVSDLQAEGIYYSDVGLVGFWYQYGLIPLFVTLYYVIKGLPRHCSFIVRANAIFILVGALTLSYFGMMECMLWLSVYFYLYFTDEQRLEAERLKAEQKALNVMKKYRSIAE